MTREELAEKVNELLIERATSETKTALHEKAMSLIDLYAESREIPPPPLKWVRGRFPRLPSNGWIKKTTSLHEWLTS